MMQEKILMEQVEQLLLMNGLVCFIKMISLITSFR